MSFAHVVFSFLNVMEEETVPCLETCHSLEASRLVNYTPNFSGIFEQIQKF